MRVRFRADNDLNRDIARAVLLIRPEIGFESRQLNGLNHLSTIPPLFASLRAQFELPGVNLMPSD